MPTTVQSQSYPYEIFDEPTEAELAAEGAGSSPRSRDPNAGRGTVRPRERD